MSTIGDKRMLAQARAGPQLWGQVVGRRVVLGLHHKGRRTDIYGCHGR